MAIKPQAFVVFAIFFFFVFSIAVDMTAAARNNPKDEKLHPEFKSDRSVLIPGIGRVMLPPKGSHSLHYNPITGAPKGRPVSIPRIGAPTVGAGSPRSYVPGGDDTLLPNPGVEVPNPVGGRTPTPPSAH